MFRVLCACCLSVYLFLVSFFGVGFFGGFFCFVVCCLFFLVFLLWIFINCLLS